MKFGVGIPRKLTGGATVSDTMLQGAEELLSQAEQFKAGL